MYDELVKRLREAAIVADSGYEISESLYSDILQAADAIEELQKAVNFHKFNSEFWEDKYNSLADEKWIPVEERLPDAGVHVLLACKCGAGAYVCDGFHTEKYSTPTQFYEDIDADYNEDADEYYFPEGWWEVIKNWDDYSCVAIEDKVTNWMPLPEPPEEE